jgi:hypothetical protein
MPDCAEVQFILSSIHARSLALFEMIGDNATALVGGNVDIASFQAPVLLGCELGRT